MVDNGIKKNILEKLDSLKGEILDNTLLISYEALSIICDITGEANREVAIFINRRGEIIDAVIGDYNTAELRQYSERRSEDSLSGIRCIHTHPNGYGMLSDMDISALKALKLDLIIAIGVINGIPQEAYYAYLSKKNSDYDTVCKGPFTINDFLSINAQDLISEIEKNYKIKRDNTFSVANDKEKAILVGINGLEDLDELKELLDTAGGIEVGRIAQNKHTVDNAYLIGKGKLKELKMEVQKKEANLVIFDEELTGIQIRNLERELDVRVIDRTQLILDIFAKRASSKEGKLQVELAQLKYMMPRLIGFGVQMSRTGGGIGTRGPGEKKLEIDRRRIRERVRELERDVDEIKKHRDLIRINRADSTFLVCLVGYTNAGKSTLLNSLSDSQVYVEDKLFATLDPTVRKVSLKSGQDVVISDTVGFINKLPHDLVAAFKSTLEEVVYANLLIHVVDGSNENYEEQIEVVNNVLKDLGADNKPTILAINKIDKNMSINSLYSLELRTNSDIIFISAKNKINLDKLLDRIEHYVNLNNKVYEMVIPYAEGALLAYLHDNGKIIKKEYRENGIYVMGEFDSIASARAKDYICQNQK
ncbi:GTPase HflX [Lutispora thermophila]|uniref:GTPase HflX n=1 Tax=Lutispora thermophila DSM 19022 TaxID=1122184 RepID=A0A1M6HQF0_9FIRM|nr:GTPase HflX [Lutispora thermophila]SHJ24450.1 GTP-binding protein HflX [Lutispora thermophila DSM 19022]